MSIDRRHASVILLGWLILALCGCEGVRVESCYENGAVASVSPIASEIGTQVLAEGGNAVDAAVAVGFTLAVVYPQAGNLGGGGFAVVRDGQSGRIRALDFREKAPAAASENMYLDSSGNVIEDLSTLGALSSGVPGSVAGLHELWRAHGTMPWETLVVRAARIADTGFLINGPLAEDLEYRDEYLRLFETTAEIFVPQGRQLELGDRLVQKDLARTIYSIAAEGPDVFYTGAVANLIDSCMVKHGGLVSRTDLEAYAPVWRVPIRFHFDSLDIYSMSPPSSGGIVLAQILKILEPYDFSRYNPNHPEYISLVVEASRLAFADRSIHLGDPDFYDVPSTLLDPEYLASRRQQILPGQAGSSDEIQPGHPPGRESEQTTHFSVCDAQGNMVAVTTTLNTRFGSCVVVEGAGFLLNNQMDDFSIRVGHPNTWGLIGGEANKIEPSKRMLSSMTPTLVLKNGEPFLITGSPGGSKIITTVAKSIIDFTRFRRNLNDVVSCPRFHHQWLPDTLYLEEDGFDLTVRRTLESYGYSVKERSLYGDLQMIFIDPGGLVHAASDPRNGGAPAGY
ncbi:MAG: gamma-glutamyltransferase [Candidatus Zixiibacteriota bacterium]|nr:MAG: gamma-glutamyltransferase [candidate division Zixibacteria bacterium]